MMPLSRIALAIVLMSVVDLAAAAQESSIPSIDTQKLCRTRAAQSAQMMGDQSMLTRAFDSCVRSEQEARTALLAAWKDIPQNYKTFCVRPHVYSPSYTEWIACIESNIDVTRLRSKK
jgi:hypothetical protein